MDTVNLAGTIGLVMALAGSVLRTLLVGRYLPVDGFQWVALLAGAVLGVVLSIVLVILKPAGTARFNMGFAAVCLVLGCAMVATAVAVGLNGLLDGSTPIDVPATVVNNGARLATLGVASPDGTQATFDIAARRGTYREGRILTATLHAGAFHRRWCERVR